MIKDATVYQGTVIAITEHGDVWRLRMEGEEPVIEKITYDPDVETIKMFFEQKVYRT